MARGTRENAAGIDLNRDYKQPVTPEIRAHVGWLQRQAQFAAVFCLHEDYEANGFYLYELNPERRPTVADAALAAVAPLCPMRSLMDAKRPRQESSVPSGTLCSATIGPRRFTSVTIT